MPGHGRKAIDERLLMALACGASIESAARAVGISEATVHRRLREPAFRQRLQDLRADMVQRTSGALTAASTEAVKTLLAMMKDATPAPVRLGAAKAVLEIGIKLRSLAELEDRIKALEAQLGQTG